MNITSTLAQFVRSQARRELKPLLMDAKKRAAEHRRAIAALKRQLLQVTRELAEVKRHAPKPSFEPAPQEALKKARMRFDGLKNLRSRLGLSAADFGKLVGVSALTIYNWESKKSKPRRKHLPRIIQVRQLGKKQAQLALRMMKVD